MKQIEYNSITRKIPNSKKNKFRRIFNYIVLFLILIGILGAITYFIK